MRVGKNRVQMNEKDIADWTMRLRKSSDYTAL